VKHGEKKKSTHKQNQYELSGHTKRKVNKGNKNLQNKKRKKRKKTQATRREIEAGNDRQSVMLKNCSGKGGIGLVTDFLLSFVL